MIAGYKPVEYVDVPTVVDDGPIRDRLVRVLRRDMPVFVIRASAVIDPTEDDIDSLHITRVEGLVGLVQDLHPDKDIIYDTRLFSGFSFGGESGVMHHDAEEYDINDDSFKLFVHSNKKNGGQLLIAEPTFSSAPGQQLSEAQTRLVSEARVGQYGHVPYVTGLIKGNLHSAHSMVNRGVVRTDLLKPTVRKIHLRPGDTVVLREGGVQPVFHRFDTDPGERRRVIASSIVHSQFDSNPKYQHVPKTLELRTGE